jgi:hypothetical protein
MITGKLVTIIQDNVPGSSSPLFVMFILLASVLGAAFMVYLLYTKIFHPENLPPILDKKFLILLECILLIIFGMISLLSFQLYTSLL